MKKIALFLIFTLLCCALCGCAGKGGATMGEVEIEKYVTLGEYKGLTYTNIDTSVSEFQYTLALNKKFSENGFGVTSEKEIKEGKVQVGDTANIDYEGKKDGVAFEGGTAKGYDLEIGSGSFISGFEEGLVGVAIGDTVDLNLTFPADYGNEELAGAAVIFTVKVNSVTKRTDYPALDDIHAQKMDDQCSNVEEFKKNLLTELQEGNQEEALKSIKNEIWAKVLENATFAKDLPKAILEKATKQYTEYYTSVGLQYGYQDLDSFLSANGMTKDTLTQMAASMVKQQLAAHAIAKAEGYAVSDQEFDASAKDLATAAGYDDIKKYVDLVGKDTIIDQLTMDYAVNLVLENAKAK